MQSLTQLSFITPQTLKRGNSGQDVKFLQQLLNNALYPDLRDKNQRLVVDGLFGRKTEEAVRIFQGPHNDGIVSAKTWRALGAYANILP
jgi:peptidoglycan hydrolase-like protein with peptidoglycan-binding domain